jgi:hypothetical protein
MMLSWMELRILDTLSEGAYSIKELYVNFCNSEMSLEEFFAALQNLNDLNFVIMSAKMGEYPNKKLSQSQISAALSDCLRTCEDDWKRLPELVIDPSEKGYAYLDESGLGHPR